eukprot:3295705-Alexandrium_andersonii.AAC.1
MLVTLAPCSGVSRGAAAPPVALLGGHQPQDASESEPPARAGGASWDMDPRGRSSPRCTAG